MIKKKPKIIIFVSLALALAFFVFAYVLSVKSFRNFAKESMLENCNFTFNEGIRKLESMIEDEKYVFNRDAIVSIMEEMRANTHEGIIKNILLIKKSDIIYSLSSTVDNEILPEYVKKRVDFTIKEPRGIRCGNEYHYYIPLVGGGNLRFVGIDVIFNSDLLEINHINEKYLKEYQLGTLTSMLVIFLVCVVLLVFIVTFVPLCKEEGQYSKKAVGAIIVSVILVAQFSFMIRNKKIYMENYTELIKTNTDISAEYIKNRLGALIDKGYSYNDRKISEEVIFYLDLLENNSKLIDGAYTIDTSSSSILTITGGIDKYKILESEKYVSNYFTLKEDSKGIMPGLFIVISDIYINEKLAFLKYYSLLLMLISILISMETTRVLINKINYIKVQDEEHISKQPDKLCYIHILEFIFLMGASMCLTIIPLMVNDLWIPKQIKVNLFFANQSISQMSNELALPSALSYSIPVALEMLFCAIAMLIAGVILKKSGWKRLFIFGVLILCTGIMYSVKSDNLCYFYIARCICGTGFGFGFIALKSTMDINGNLSKVKYSAIPCGVVIGALIFDNFGLSEVFYISFATVLLSGLIVTFLKIPMHFKMNERNKGAVVYDERNSNRIAKIMFFMAIVIPFSVSGMFLDFFYPISCYDEGIDWDAASNVAMIFVIAAFITLFVASLFKRLLFKFIDVKLCAVFISIVVFASFLYVSRYENIVIIAIITMAILSLAGEEARLYHLRQLSGVDIDTGGIGKWYACVWIGRSIGALAFGYFAALETNFGVGIIAMIGFNISILYMIFTWSCYKNIVITKIIE